MDLEKLANHSTEYLSEYLYLFAATLHSPALRFEPLKTEDNGLRLNPKLLSFVIISIYIGSNISALIPGKKVGPDIETTIISVIAIWFIYGSFVHFVCKLLRGTGTYIETLSVSLQLFAVLHVVSGFAALIFNSINVYFLVQFVLMVIYLPMAVKYVHNFGLSKQIIIGILPVMIVIFGIYFYLLNGVFLAPK